MLQDPLIVSILCRLFSYKTSTMLIDIEKVSMLRDHVPIIFIAVHHTIYGVDEKVFAEKILH